jgi:hypothetical protein
VVGGGVIGHAVLYVKTCARVVVFTWTSLNDLNGNNNNDYARA